MHLKRGCAHRRKIWPVLLYLVLTLWYFAELAFSLTSKQRQRVGPYDQLIWHPTRRVEADLELNLVKY